MKILEGVTRQWPEGAINFWYTRVKIQAPEVCLPSNSVANLKQLSFATELRV
jgi:hypothetical protein